MEAKRRLVDEFEDITNDPPPGVSANLPDEDNVMVWRAILCGPESTPFAGGMFELEMKFPETYPETAPEAVFISKMFHPNVYANGKVCIDILEKPECWKSTYSVKSVLFAIQGMLGDPNPDSPANIDAYKLFKADPDEFGRRVLEMLN